jgi:hypothetical protein
MKLDTVVDRCRAIATFREVSVKLMEMLALWTPTTPEMEVKVLFGRHIWDLAQQADALGKRTFELRAPAQHSLAPAAEYEELLATARATVATSERVSTFYEALLPALAARFQQYIDASDPILDQPSVVILERFAREMNRMCAEAASIRKEISLAAANVAELAARDRAIPSLVRSASA